MPSPLPGYTYDRVSSRYRSLQTGRYVARSRIVDLLDGVVSGTERRLAGMATAAVEGTLSPAVFAERMRTELRRLHLQNAAMGAGGWDRLSFRDYGRIGGKLRADYARISRFANQIAAGEVTAAQAINRANMYAGNARIEFWEAQRDRIQSPPGMVPIERRILGAAEHCPDCVEYYNMGWQPVGVLPVPGIDSQCLTNCKCTMEERVVSADDVGEWVGTMRQQ